MIGLLAVLKNTMKWPGRDFPGKGGFPAWHRAAPGCQQGSGTITDSPAAGPWGDPPWHPSAVGGRVAPRYLFTPSPLRVDTPKGQATPPPPFPTQSVMQLLHKSSRWRKKQNDKSCPGLMPAAWHSNRTGKGAQWPCAPMPWAAESSSHPCPAKRHRSVTALPPGPRLSQGRWVSLPRQH